VLEHLTKELQMLELKNQIQSKVKQISISNSANIF